MLISVSGIKMVASLRMLKDISRNEHEAGKYSLITLVLITA